jgi:L-rhamnose isomerase
MVREVVVGGYLDRVHIGLDYFDASINRIAAWPIGARNVMRAALVALLEPTEQLRAYENEGDYSSRLALLEEAKGLPWQAVWNYFCLQQDVLVGMAFMKEAKAYEERVLAKRSI